jgi:hypothetical protein
MGDRRNRGLHRRRARKHSYAIAALALAAVQIILAFRNSPALRKPGDEQTGSGWKDAGSLVLAMVIGVGTYPFPSEGMLAALILGVGTCLFLYASPLQNAFSTDYASPTVEELSSPLYIRVFLDATSIDVRLRTRSMQSFECLQYGWQRAWV